MIWSLHSGVQGLAAADYASADCLESVDPARDLCLLMCSSAGRVNCLVVAVESLVVFALDLDYSAV